MSALRGGCTRMSAIGVSTAGGGWRDDEDDDDDVESSCDGRSGAERC